MEVILRKTTVEGLTKKHPEIMRQASVFSVYREGRGVRDFENEMRQVEIDDLSLSQIEILQKSLQEHYAEIETKAIRGLSLFVKTMKNPEDKPIRVGLSEFAVILKEYFVRAYEADPRADRLIKQDIFDMKGIAYLPESVRFRPEDRSRDRPALVELDMIYNYGGMKRSHSIEFYASDIRGLTIAEILREKSQLVLMTSELAKDYDAVMSRYERTLEWHGEQVLCKGIAVEVDSDRGGWWNRPEVVDLSRKGHPTKAVVDMEVDGNNMRDRHYADRSANRAKRGAHTMIYSKSMEVPSHPVIPVWSLAYHKLLWVNVTNVKRYAYEEGLGEKLVLPSSHRRLIGALVTNLEVLRASNDTDRVGKSNTIHSKARSNVILAAGPPGTGKTLTAEVYSEEIKRPLYEVHSGQLGSEPQGLEEELQVILQRATRLRMPLLINEADVFIRRRGDDVVQNAICAVFLRHLEYHDGLIFLTTNRGDSVDDAFLSRCIAEINYGKPGPKERARLWEVLLAEFDMTLDTPYSELAKVFPSVVGRDIQNLILLTSRVCAAHKRKMTLEDLKECAIFKRVEVLKE